jgi:hypothetical protein
MKLSLQNRILLTTISLIVLGLGLTSTFSYLKARSALEHEITESLTQKKAIPSSPPFPPGCRTANWIWIPGVSNRFFRSP